jgi:hypothetical protein
VVTVHTTKLSAEKLHFCPQRVYDSHEELNHMNGLLFVMKIKSQARTKVAFLLSVYPAVLNSTTS